MRIDKVTVGIGIVGLVVTAYVLYCEVSRFTGTNSKSSDDNDSKKE